MTERMGYPSNDLYRSCLEEGEEELLQLFYVIVPSYRDIERQYLERCNDNPLMSVLKFIKSSQITRCTVLSCY